MAILEYYKEGICKALASFCYPLVEDIPPAPEVISVHPVRWDSSFPFLDLLSIYFMLRATMEETNGYMRLAKITALHILRELRFNMPPREFHGAVTIFPGGFAPGLILL